VTTRYLRTTDIAYALAIHPNTVRVYEEWKLLPPIPRTPSGYRMFTQAHLDQMRLVRSAMHFTWLGGAIRRTLYQMIERAASGNLGGALELAYSVLVQIRTERTQAEAAVSLLERWAQGTATDATDAPLSIGQVARRLNVTHDMLRNWERNGLLTVPRDPDNGYRRYGPAEIGRLRVIRTLRHARYSPMAILRMLRQLDADRDANLRQALDTPDPEDDVGAAADRWLSTLASLEPRAADLIPQLEAMIQRQMEKPTSRKAASAPGGRAIVVAEFADVLRDALDRIAPALGDEYRLIGTAAALLQGVFLPIHDVNLLVKTREQVDAAARALADFPCLTPPTFMEEEQRYTTTTLIQGIEMNVMCVERETSTDGLETAGPGPWTHAAPIPCGAHTVPAVALELRLATELARNRADRIAPLLQHLRRHPCDLPLLQSSMDANAIPAKTQQSILAQLSHQI